MKHLGRCPKSQSFAGAIIQSVFDHFNFLVVDVFHRTFLRHILAQQTIEVLVTAAFPARKRPGKVARTPQRFINQCMSAELFAVVVGQRLDPGLEGRECLDDRLTYQVRRLV